jgi:hypothetical protein
MLKEPFRQRTLLPQSLLLLCVLILFGPSWAAPEIGQRSGFGIGVSLAYAQVRDNLIVPFRTGGPQLSVQLAYARRDAASRLELNAGLGLAVLADRYWFLGGMISPTVSCRYLRRIGAGGGDGFQIGGQLRWAIHEELPEYWDSEHLYWLTAIDVAPAAGYSRRLSPDQQLEATFAVPLAGMISRPPLRRYIKNEPNTLAFSLGRPHQDLKFATLDRYQAGVLEVAWREGLPNHDLVLAYRAELARAVEPKSFTELVHTVGVRWEFGR